MSRITRGWRLAVASWAVLRQDPALIWLSVASTLSILVFAAAILGPTWHSVTIRNDRPQLYLALAAVYFVSSLVSVFFNAAIVAAASDRMEGGQGRVRTGLRIASARLDRLLLWAALSATVGLVIRAIEQRGGIVGAVAGRLAGVAWSVTTFLVVPVLVFEPVGPVEAVRRSAHLFRRRWGEQLVGNGSIGIVTGLVALVVGVICVVIASQSLAVAVALAVLGFGTLMAVSTTLTAIFNAALYRFVVTGTARGPFSDSDLSGAFRRRGGSSALGMS